MISLILTKKICSLLLVLLSGSVLARTEVLDKESGKSLSTVLLYLVTPCSILSAFQIEYSSQTRDGLLLAFALGFISLICMLVAANLLEHILHLDAVETVSVIYSNAGNLIIPIVAAIWGRDYVIFCSAYICLQQFFMWSHGKSVICGEKRIDLKKMFANVNIIAAAIGMLCFFARIQYPAVLDDTIQWVGDMVGPMAMLITGIQLGGMNRQKLFGFRRVWLIVFIRLIAFPLMSVLLLRFLPFGASISAADTIKTISLLGMVGPTAANITAMARLYGNNAEYASVINVITTLLCIFTIPCMIALFQLL